MQAELPHAHAESLPVTQNPATSWTTGLLLKTFYFFFYGSMGVYLVFFAPYLRGLGFSGEQIGLVQMVSPVVGLVATLGWASIADRFRTSTRALRFCTLLALAPLFFLPWARTPWQVAAVLLVHDLAAPALGPLLDSVTFEWLKGQDAGNYSRTRLFGTIGGLTLVQCFGSLLTLRGERPGDIVMPLGLLFCVAVYAAVAQKLPPAPLPDRPPEVRDLRELNQNRHLSLLLGVCLVHWLCYASYDLLFGVYLRDRGMPSSFPGLGLSTGPLAEVLVLAAFPLLERRLRVDSLLAITFAAAALRWGLLSVATSATSIAALQFLHGAMSGLFWATVVKAIGVIVPARLRVTGHALFSAIVVNGGNTLGYRLAGFGYDQLGGCAPLFFFSAILEIVPLVLILLLGRRLIPESTP